jgi:Fe-S cluster assembly protein SufD
MMLVDTLKKAYQNNLPQDLIAFRKKAWDQFVFPEKKSEHYRYYPLHQLHQQQFSHSNQKTEIDEHWVSQQLEEHQTDSYLLFVNGNYHSSKGKAHILSIKQALKTYGSFLKQQWQREMSREKDPFSLLNFTFQDSGAFIYIPPNQSIEKLLILNIITEENSLNFSRSHCFLSQGSQCKLIVSTQTKNSEHALSSHYLGVHLEENSHLSLYTENPNTTNLWGFETVRAQQKKDSTFNLYSLRTSSSVWRDDYNVQLLQKNSSVALQGAWLLKEKQQCHTHITVEHLEEQCNSRQDFKGILNDFSRSNFYGKVYVDAKAQQTDAFQLNNNLLLSDKAYTTTTPLLKIFADDVKASHGATVGQIDKNELFYLCSRGLTLKEATKLIVKGFALKFMKEMPFSNLHQRWSDSISGYLKN